MKKHDYVSINGQTIRNNAKWARDNPPIRVASSPSDRHPRYAHEVELTAPARLIYNPTGAIMSCGARLVIVTTEGSVKIVPRTPVE